MNRIPFETKFYKADGNEKTIDHLPKGYKFRRLADGLSVVDCEGEHAGNIKPAYQSEAKVLRLWALAGVID